MKALMRAVIGLIMLLVLCPTVAADDDIYLPMITNGHTTELAAGTVVDFALTDTRLWCQFAYVTAPRLCTQSAPRTALREGRKKV